VARTHRSPDRAITGGHEKEPTRISNGRTRLRDLRHPSAWTWEVRISQGISLPDPLSLSKEVQPVQIDHKDGDPDKTQEEYDRDNHSDQENPNNDEYDK
jgi:hypothetical protein